MGKVDREFKVFPRANLFAIPWVATCRDRADMMYGHGDSFERQEQLKADREGMEQQGPLRGSDARQALAAFFL